MLHKSAKCAALYGVLTALALVLSWAEAQIPAFFAIPGMKLGLTNIVVLLALYCIGPGAALVINLVRILLVSLLFGNGASLIYSLCGGMLSTVVMLLLKRTGLVRILFVSIAGGVFHNIGQILAAMLLLQTTSLVWYLAILWFSGMASGALIGIISGIVCRRVVPVIGSGK